MICLKPTFLCLLSFVLPTTALTQAPLPSASTRLATDAESGLMSDGGVSRGVAWGDFTGDGWPDLAVANTDDGRVFLYQNQNGQTFKRQKDSAVEQVTGKAQGVTWTDVNNDGWLDLFVTVEEAVNRLYLNDGEGSLEPTDAGELTRNVTNSTQACWADVDNDGLLDVYVVNADYQDDALYRNLDGQTFEAIKGPWQGKANHGRSCAWADPDNNGMPDLYVANAYFKLGEATRYAANAFYHNQGSTQFIDVTNSEFVATRGYSYGVSWFDFDADGDEDLFVSNISRYDPNALYENAGSLQFFAKWSSQIMRDVPGPVKGHVWADFDNDGDTDLLLAEGHGGARPEHAPFDNVNRYYEQREGKFIPVDAGSLTSDSRVSAGAAAADVDRDGDLDVFIANWFGDDLNNQFFRNHSEGNWIVIKLQGTKSNRLGVGARVRVTTQSGEETQTQYKSLWLNTGYASMNEPVLHFGLGDATSIQLIEISWPSGSVDQISDFDVNQRLVVKEGEHSTSSAKQ